METDYFLKKGINSSLLKKIINSEIEFVDAINRKSVPTNAMQLGTELHNIMENWVKTKTLPKKSIEDAEILEFGENPNRRLKAYQEWKKTCKLPNVNALGMAKSIEFYMPKKYKDIILTEGEPEKEIFLDIPVKTFQEFSYNPTGEKISVKMKADVITKNYIFDWKTISKIPNERNIEFAMRDFHYWLQAVHYIEIAKEYGYEIRNFIFIFVQSSPPYHINFLNFSKDNADIMLGIYYKILKRANELLLGDKPRYSALEYNWNWVYNAGKFDED